MKLPVRFVAGNLIWARDGSAWAVFRVPGLPYPWLADREKLDLHHRIRSALLWLPQESMLLGLCRRLTPAQVAGAVAAGIDPQAHPAWAAAAGRAASLVGETGAYERVHFLAARLPASRAAAGLSALAGAAASGLAEAFGLPPEPVRRGDAAARARQSEQLQLQLRAAIAVVPASAAEVRWIYERAVRRGAGEPPLRAGWNPAVRVFGEGPDSSVAGPGLAMLADAVFKEGGLPGDPDRPRHRRYLRVESEDGVGFQALLCMSDMPHRFRFPGGGEWLYAAEAAPFPVDWCVRLRAVPNRDAQVKAKRQARQLSGQVGEYEGEPAGAPQSLADAIGGIQDLRAELSGNPADPELQAVMVYTVWSDRLAELEERAAALRSMFTAFDYDLHRPTGGQLPLFASTLPGGPAAPPLRDYTQYLLPRDLAAGMPFATCEVGDPHGMLLGYSLDAGTLRPVLLDPAHGPSINRSGSLGIFGALGSGKSYLVKSIAHAAVARGAQVVALDRTATGEYVELAGVMPGRTQVVRLAAGAALCLDPLRVFAGEERTRVTRGFLTLLTGAAPSELQGTAIAEAVREAAGRAGARIGDALAALERAGAADPDARVVWRKLRAFAGSELGALVFGDGPALELDADYVVFHTPGLSLPNREVLASEHLARQLLPEQILSQALLYLVAAAARSVIFADVARFGAALFDEAWSLTASMQGRALLLDSVRDGRKHNAAVWLVSQHPNDLGDDELAHLLGSRFVFRQSRAAAPAALHFLGVEPSERAVRTVVEAGEGCCLFRDVRDRVGLVQVLPALGDELHRAFDTNPVRGGAPAVAGVMGS